jgi:hypothetical protein
MYWYNLNSDILKNMEIQIPLDVYQEETPYPTNLSFPKNKKREKKLTNINDYQGTVKNYVHIIISNIFRFDNYYVTKVSDLR